MALKPVRPHIRPDRCSRAACNAVYFRVFVDCSATTENASTSTDRTAQVWNHQASHHCVALATYASRSVWVCMRLNMRGRSS